MTGPLDTLLDVFAEQADLLADWLDRLADEAFLETSSLPPWDLRTLLGHVVRVQTGLAHRLRTRSDDPPIPLAPYVSRYRAAAGEIADQAVETRGDHTPAELIEILRDAAPARDALAGVGPRTVLDGPRGPITAEHWLVSRVVDIVVHCDDFSRSLPDRDPVPLHRPALALTVRTLAEVLAAQASGRSVEVRDPALHRRPSHRRPPPHPRHPTQRRRNRPRDLDQDCDGKGNLRRRSPRWRRESQRQPRQPQQLPPSPQLTTHARPRRRGRGGCERRACLDRSGRNHGAA